MDPMVPIAFGKGARDALVERGQSVEWHEYLVEHGVNQDEFKDMGKFLVRVLSS